MKKLIVTSFLVISVSILMGGVFETAEAIPAFSRKYETSCQTCHITFPKLTAFGEAFRRNWYQFPQGTDPEYTKDEPISLGSEGYKRVFPKAVWPGALSRLPSLSVISEGEFLYLPEAEEGAQKLSFDEAAAEVEVLMSGTLGENISFFWEVEVKGEEVELEVGTINFSNLLASQLKPNLLNLRIGKFVPEFIANGHRQLIPGHPWLGMMTVGNNKWALLRTQKGLELNGVIKGHLGYDLGLVEGRKNLPNTAKDLYAHFAYKVGGLRLDGVTPEGAQPTTEKPKPWQDDSVTVDAFAYLGFANIKIDEKTSQDDNFQMFGGDVNFFFKDLNVIGGVALQHHAQPTAEKQAMNALHLFGEASYVLYPWLIPLVRFETFKLEEEATMMRILPMLNFLLRPNIKAILAAEIEKEEEKFEPEEIEFALAIGF